MLILRWYCSWRVPPPAPLVCTPHSLILQKYTYIWIHTNKGLFFKIDSENIWFPKAMLHVFSLSIVILSFFFQTCLAELSVSNHLSGCLHYDFVCFLFFLVNAAINFSSSYWLCVGVVLTLKPWPLSPRNTLQMNHPSSLIQQETRQTTASLSASCIFIFCKTSGRGKWALMQLLCSCAHDGCDYSEYILMAGVWNLYTKHYSVFSPSLRIFLLLCTQCPRWAGWDWYFVCFPVTDRTGQW